MSGPRVQLADPDGRHTLLVAVPVDVDDLADPRVVDRLVARAARLAREALTGCDVREELADAG